jgi:hypothetical protein
MLTDSFSPILNSAASVDHSTGGGAQCASNFARVEASLFEQIPVELNLNNQKLEMEVWPCYWHTSSITSQGPRKSKWQFCQTSLKKHGSMTPAEMSNDSHAAIS